MNTISAPATASAVEVVNWSRPRLALRLIEIVEAGLVDRDLAAAQRGDPLGVDVDAGDVVAEVREPSAGDEADVAGADDGDLHRAAN